MKIDEFSSLFVQMNITDKIAAESLIALTAIFSSFAGISGVDIYYTLLLLFNL